MDANPAEGANQLTYPVADETFRNKVSHPDRTLESQPAPKEQTLKR